MVGGKPSENVSRPRPIEGRKTPLLKKTLLICLYIYIQQFDAENISVENALFVTVCRTIFEKSGGAIAPASPMASRCLSCTPANTLSKAHLHIGLSVKISQISYVTILMYLSFLQICSETVNSWCWECHFRKPRDICEGQS